MLDAWTAPPETGGPAGCVATTFTFDPSFFEEECLARFLDLSTALLEDVTAAQAAYYIAEREEALGDVPVTVIVDRAHAAPSTSHRWDVVTALVPHGGAQHAKVSVLVWERAVRVVVASANLTRRGYRSNVEAAWVLDYHAGDEPSVQAGLIRDAISFLRRVTAERTRGEIGTESPRGRALATLASAHDFVPEAAVAAPRRGEPLYAFVDTLKSEDLLAQAFGACWKYGPPSELDVVSPYFTSNNEEAHPHGLDAARDRLARRGPPSTIAAATILELNDQQARVELPEVVRNSRGRGPLNFARWPRGTKEETRFLHAKALLFRSRDWRLVIAGSANCTAAGLGVPGHAHNVEACIAVGHRPGSGVTSWVPRFGPLPNKQLTWEVPLAEEAEDTDRRATLPDKFVEALYDPRTTEIHIEVDPDSAPHDWTISDGDEIWFSSDASARASSLVRAVGTQPAPFVLTVGWTANDECWSADLVVNVSARHALPPPPDLVDLTLDELLELLAAGSRFRWALNRLIARRSRHTHSTVAIELDPHAEVDTSGFVLQRMRRAARALEGLRERLERPVSHADVLRRRLFGSFGPVDLRTKLDAARDSGDLAPPEHAFLVAEVALMLRRVRWNPSGPDVPPELCAELASEVVADLAPTACGDASIDRYVRRVFEEAA